MKKVFSILTNVLPLFVWMLIFYLKFNDIAPMQTKEIAVLLIFPILFSVFNYNESITKKEFILRNCLFALSHIAGILADGILWYKLVSSDSGTAYLTAVLSHESLIYIFVITLIMYFIKRHKEKKAK
ncbi:MAG: hypothetical protein IKU43_00065 [Clostridia bacterium]|nr:hypothetical protein [Clostridia bacterium]